MCHIVLLFCLDAEPSEAEDYSQEDVEEEIIFSRVHGAIKMLLHVIPM